MKIIIDCRNTRKEDIALRIFTLSYWQEMALLQPAHQFFFISNQTIQPLQTSNSNNTSVSYLKESGLSFFNKIKYEQLVKALKGDKLVMPQPMGFSVHPIQKAKTLSAVGKTIQFLKEPTSAVTDTQSVENIQPVWQPVYETLSWTEAESIKTQFSGGRSFFISCCYTSNEKDLIALLQAFSVFKKWQQSNMQLLIVVDEANDTGTFEEKLTAYKYRQDVVLIKHAATTEIAKLIAAAYAVIHCGNNHFFPLGLLQAVQSGKAVIATDSPANRQLCEAAIWVNPNQIAEDCSKAMIALYKDEDHLQELVQQSSVKAKTFNRAAMLNHIWQCLQN